MTRKMHLALFGLTGPECWRSDSSHLFDWRKSDLMTEVARLGERAKMDMILIADGPSMATKFRGTLQWAAEYGLGVLVDPMLTLARLSGFTNHIGLGATVSSTFTPPYIAARQMGSLDHLSGGRAAWNVVTSSDHEAAANFGADHPDHDIRYDMADEHLKICRALWNSWDDDAIVEDREKGIFADYKKIHRIDFKGKYYSCRGPLNMTPSPQREPVIIMAGTSPRGQQFAIDNADMVIAHKNTVEDMKTYTKEIRTKLEQAGRDPRSCKVFFAIRPWLGASEAEALEKMEQNKAQARFEDGLGYLSQGLGVDLAQFDLDQPLDPDMPVNAIIGKLTQYTQSLNKMTLREIGMHEAQRETFPIWGTPEQVANKLEETFLETDADGFHFRLALQDYNYVVDITTKLIPILQRRGLFRKEYSGRKLKEHLFGPQL